MNQVEKFVNAIFHLPDETSESEGLPSMLNEHSLGEFNKFAEADSVVLYSLMQAFPLPTKFLQALADFELWSNIQGQDDHDDGDDCDHDTVGFCYKQEIMDIGQ